MTREEAIERIKARFDKWALDDEDMKAIQSFIPELRESEDEKIRKDLIAFLIDMKDGDVGCFPSQSLYQRWIAYLEKQKGQKPSIFPPGLGEVHWNPILCEQKESENISASTMIPSCREVEQKEQKHYWKPTETDVALFNKAVTTNKALTPAERAQLDIIRSKFGCCRAVNCNGIVQKEQNDEAEEYTDFTIYHPLKNAKGEYECIPYSFYGSLTSFSEDKDLIDFLRTCFYTKEECHEWIEMQKEQKPNYCHHEVDETGWTEEYQKAYYDGWNNCNMQHSQLKAEQKLAECINIEKLAEHIKAEFESFRNLLKKKGIDYQPAEVYWTDFARLFVSSTKKLCKPAEWSEDTVDEFTRNIRNLITDKLTVHTKGINGSEIASTVFIDDETAKDIASGVLFYVGKAATKNPNREIPEWSEDYREEDIQTRFAFYTYKDVPRVLYLSNVFVEEASRNHGFGTCILKAVEKVAEAIDAITIRLKVKQDSPANAWYRKHGYSYLTFEDGYDWLEKNLEYMKPNKQEWSEEDVKRLYSIGTQIGFLKGRYSEHQKDIDWLYALADKMGFHKCKTGEVVTEWKKEDIDDKMLSKSKQEWSEEDEVMLKEIISFFKDGSVKLQHDLDLYAGFLENRLKSIRSQPIQLKEAYKDGFQTARHAMALAFMNYLDENRPKGKMCLSSGECEDIDKAFKEGDWAKIMRYYEKYRPSWKPSEEQMKALNTLNLYGNLSYVGQQNQLISLCQDLNKLM